MGLITATILTRVCSPTIFSESWSHWRKPKRQPRQPKTQEEKPKPTPKIEIPDATAKKFRPLSEKELEFYGSLNWEDNPPINGFYETMMSIAHRQIAEMEAERQAKEASKQEVITENGTVIEKTGRYSTPKPRVTTPEKPKAAEIERPAVEEKDISPRKFSEDIQYFHHNGSMVVDKGQVGFLSEVKKNGATFTPLPIKPEQEKRAMLYITLSETYQQLYHYEAETHEENADMREHLNQYYDEFVDRYGNLNEKQNAKFILMDANGRDALALERGENGHFVKADIFDHPVSFAVDEVTSVDTPMEALSASLNKYGEVNLEYMGGLVDMEQDAIIDSLAGHIYYNPLVSNFEIADRFIAGNVVQKAEEVKAWIDREEERIKDFPGLTVLSRLSTCRGSL